MAWYCSKCKKEWVHDVLKCTFCGLDLEKMTEAGKVIAVTKVMVPSPEHPSSPYYNAVVEDSLGFKKIVKSETEPHLGKELNKTQQKPLSLPKGFLTGKKILVTGGASGIGAAIVKMALEAGAMVCFSYIANDEGARELEGKGGLAFKKDVSSEIQVKELAGEISAKWDRLDVIINNAGITSDAAFGNMSADAWDSVIKNNLTSAFYTSKNCLPLLNDGGRIVNISSIVGLDGNAGQANYAASKAGLIGLTKSLAKELASRKITVNAIAPGFIETRMTKKIPEGIQAQIKQRIPLGRFGRADEIASFVLFLSSDYASYATGSVFRIDGGFNL